MNNTLTTERYFRREIKFYLPKSIIKSFREDILPYMNHDPYAKKEENLAYIVHSIYYDSPELKHFYEKVHGIKKRKKIRLRAYGDIHDIREMYLEIKHKNDKTIEKDRVKIPKEILTNHTRYDHPTIKTFYYLLKRYRMQPRAQITYLREPFIGKWDRQLRLTFDSDIMAQTIHSPRFVSPRLPVLQRDAILEVKYDQILPSWLHELILAYELQQTTYSKYCQGMCKLHESLIM